MTTAATPQTIDRVFMSNFLEHLRTKQEVLQTFEEIFRVLKVGGKVITLHPNIRYLYMDYWDYFDHHVPLTDKSIAEGLEVVGFKVEISIDRFLPFTKKSKIYGLRESCGIFGTTHKLETTDTCHLTHSRVTWKSQRAAGTKTVFFVFLKM